MDKAYTGCERPEGVQGYSKLRTVPRWALFH